MNKRGFVTSTVGDFTAVVITVLALVLAAVLFATTNLSGVETNTLSSQITDSFAHQSLMAVLKTPLPTDIDVTLKKTDEKLGRILSSNPQIWDGVDVAMLITNLAMPYEGDLGGYLDGATQQYLLTPILQHTLPITGKKVLAIDYPPYGEEPDVIVTLGDDAASTSSTIPAKEFFDVATATAYLPLYDGKNVLVRLTR